MSLFKRKKQPDIPRRRQVSDENVSISSDNTFKRNRTMPGVCSINLEDIKTKLDLGDTPRTHVHHLTIKRRKVFSILMAIVLISLSIWLFICNYTAEPVVSVSDTSISTPVDYKSYQKAIQDYFGINPMGRFHFLLDETNLTDYLSSKMPEVEGVSQEGMVGIGQTDFVITMRKPIASWSINSKQYYVDSTGIAFEKNYYATPEVKVVDNSNISVQSSTALVSNRMLSFVGLVVSTAKSSGYTVTQATLPINTTRELDITIKERAYFVKLSLDRPVGEQIEDMSRAISYLTSKGRVPGYVDVRVSGKAFYK